MSRAYSIPINFDVFQIPLIPKWYEVIFQFLAPLSTICPIPAAVDLPSTAGGMFRYNDWSLQLTASSPDSELPHGHRPRSQEHLRQGFFDDGDAVDSEEGSWDQIVTLLSAALASPELCRSCMGGPWRSAEGAEIYAGEHVHCRWCRARLGYAV